MGALFRNLLEAQQWTMVILYHEPPWMLPVGLTSLHNQRPTNPSTLDVIRFANDASSASVLTIVQSAWNFSIKLKNLIHEIKVQQESVGKLEQKAGTLAAIINEVQSSYGAQDGRTDNWPIDSSEDNIRTTVRNLTLLCRDDLDEFQHELSKLLHEKTTGRFRMGMVVTTWRIQVAGPTFARIEKSIEGHESSLHLLLNVLHGRSLDATRRVIEERFTDVLASNERTLATLQLLASSPERPALQDTSPNLEPMALHRKGTDVPLVALPTVVANGDHGMLKDDDARILQKLFAQILAAWLNQTDVGKGSSESSDRSIGLVGPMLDGSTVAHKPSQILNIEPLSRGRSKIPFSPKLGQIDLPEPLSSTATHSTDVSQHPDLANKSLYSDSTASTSAPSEASTANQTASKQLSEAVTKKDIDWMKTLIDSELKPDIEVRDPMDKRKMTPLLLAVKLGDVKTVTLLHSKGANLEAKDDLGMTPLILAASLNNVEIMQELIARGAVVRAEDNRKRTALHLAIMKSSERAISFLLDLNNTNQRGQADERETVNVNAADKSGGTPLHYCAEFGMLDAAELLLKHDACVEARDVANNTPAYYAIKHRKYYIVELLLAHGADFSWPWPVEPTSDEIEKLLNRKSWTRPGLKSGE